MSKEFDRKIKLDPSKIEYDGKGFKAVKGNPAVFKEKLEHLRQEVDSGIKHDQGKPKLSLVNRETLAGIAKAMEYGMKKYGKNNYKNGLDWSRVIDALLRHATAYAAKEDLDPESGLNHMYHVGACVNMLLYYIENNKGTDDR